MRRCPSPRTSLVLLAIVVAGLGCDGGGPFGPRSERPHLDISDGAHGGNGHFYLLPPLVRRPATSGVFDATLAPEVDICLLSSSAGTNLDRPRCERTIATFTTTTGTGAQRIRADVVAEQYSVDWPTADAGLDPARTYRIRVRVGAVTLGHADVDVVASGRELRNVATDEFIPLLDGRTLPIHFRIERGAVGVVDAAGGAPIGGAGGALSLSDGSVGLVVPAGALAATKTITVEPTTVEEAPAGVSMLTLFEFGPSGTSFAEPATVTLKYDPARLPRGAKEDWIRLGTMENGRWVALKNIVVDPTLKTVSGDLSHFSLVGAYVPQLSAQAPLAIAVGQVATLGVPINASSIALTVAIPDSALIAIDPVSGATTGAGMTTTYQLTPPDSVAVLEIVGVMPGVGHLALSAPDVLPDTTAVTVVPGRFALEGWPQSLAVGDSAELHLVTVGPDGDPAMLASEMTVPLAYTADLQFSDGVRIIDSITVAARSSSSGSIWVKAIGAGLDTVTLNFPGYDVLTAAVQPYSPEVIVASPLPANFVFPTVRVGSTESAAISITGSRVDSLVSPWVDSIVNVATGSTVEWMSWSLDANAWPASLTLVAAPPPGTPAGDYDFTFNLNAMGVPSLPYHFRVTVIPAVTITATPPGDGLNAELYVDQRVQWNITISSSDGSELTGLKVSQPVDAVTGATYPWLSASLRTTTSPSNLSLTVTPPLGTRAGDYDVVVELTADGVDPLPYRYRVRVKDLPDLGGSGTATVDGVFDAAEWGDAGCMEFTVHRPNDTDTPGTLCIMNDATNVYFSVRYAYDAALDAMPTVQGSRGALEVRLDANRGGDIGPNDDVASYSRWATGPQYADRFTEACGTNSLCTLNDAAQGGQSNGVAAYGNSGNEAVYEIAKPLDSKDGRDVMLSTVHGAMIMSMRAMLDIFDPRAPIGASSSLPSVFPQSIGELFFIR